MSRTKNTIYLDYNATAPMLPEVAEKMHALMGTPHNPSSVHDYGRRARAFVEDARRKVSQCAGAKGHEVVFTSGGTEANTLALNGLERVAHVVSAVEHVSVLKNVLQPKIVPVDNDGIIRLDALEEILKKMESKALVSIMLANNETGVIQPVKEAAEIVCHYGGYVHCDASQAFGKIPVDMQALNVDMLTVSAHKCGGPQGVGALIVKKGIKLSALQKGGGQEKGLRAGTENVAGIAGFGVAAEKAGKMDGALRDALEKNIKTFAPDAIIFGEKAQRLPNTSCIAMPGVSGETQVIDFDLKGFAVSSGAACSSGKVEISHVLLAMGVDEALASCAIRVSLSPMTKEFEVDAFIVAWKALYERIGRLRKAA